MFYRRALLWWGISCRCVVVVLGDFVWSGMRRFRCHPHSLGKVLGEERVVESLKMLPPCCNWLGVSRSVSGRYLSCRFAHPANKRGRIRCIRLRLALFPVCHFCVYTGTPNFNRYKLLCCCRGSIANVCRVIFLRCKTR